jgi:enterochelin esterase-like enzyme
MIIGRRWLCALRLSCALQMRISRVVLIVASIAALAATHAVQRKGSVEVFELRSRALEGNLVGDSSVRSVSVYLPPGYADDKTRRYPVVYLLHVFTDSDAKWFGRGGKHWINLPAVLDAAHAAGGLFEAIVVMPDAFNAFQGSFYSSSVTIGDWETFVADELVRAVDARYRTLTARESRGLAGHSMGGYGAMRLAMKRPDVFSAVYALSACCLTPTSGSASDKPSPAEEITALDQIAMAPFGVKAALATAAAWSPNPNKPPLYLDLATESGTPRPDVIARIAANAPVVIVPQYVFNLRRLKGIAFDVGTRDNLMSGSVALDRVLTEQGVTHTHETYDGDHLSGIAGRLVTKVMPFFRRNLTTN